MQVHQGKYQNDGEVEWHAQSSGIINVQGIETKPAVSVNTLTEYEQSKEGDVTSDP